MAYSCNVSCGACIMTIRLGHNRRGNTFIFAYIKERSEQGQIETKAIALIEL